MSEAIELPSRAVSRRSAWALASALVELAKPRIVALVGVVTGLGFAIGAAETGALVDASVLLYTLVGTALVGAAANALNQFLEQEYDALMVRTRLRPLPSRRLGDLEALAFGGSLAMLGAGILAVNVNPVCSTVAAVTLLSYVFVYTPLKRLTPLCVYVGAIPGALPPVIGWAAATGTIDRRAWILFAILYLWQLPHFAAIAWQYRDDYARGGFPMLAVLDRDGRRTNLHVVTHTIALLAVSLLPVPAGLSGAVYAVGAAVLGLAFLASGVFFLARKSVSRARLHVLASVAYLPLLLGLMMIDAR